MVGSHTLKAFYSGDASYAASSGSANLSVSKPPESTGGDTSNTSAPAPRARSVSKPPESTGGDGSPNTQTGTKTGMSTAATGKVLLDGTTIEAQRSGAAGIKLTCTGTGTCTGKLSLTAKRTTKRGKKTHTNIQAIGRATFAISAGKTTTIKIMLNATGRVLLSAAHGHLNATLTILKSSPPPAATQTASVHLALQKATRSKKGKK